MADDSRVCVYRARSTAYPSTPPFHPGVAYPEYRLGETGPDNAVYEAVRESFRLLGCDEARFGSPEWNPLGSFVRPGDTVVVKPNLIWHSRKRHPDEWEQVITHGSIVRAVTDYVLLALEGKGRVVITDGPQLDADWELILQRTGLAEVVSFYRTVTKVQVELLDLRDTYMEIRGDVKYGESPLPGDPAGGTVVDLGMASRLVDLGEAWFYGADYDQEETNLHHSAGRHEYRLSRTVMDCDVLVNLPKMKTHKKTGVTLSMKNLVGVNSGRNWLPHYRDGSPETGGDQFDHASARARAERRGVRRFQRMVDRWPALAPVYRLAKRVATPIFGKTTESVRSGNWFGNETCWRMVHDVNRCVAYYSGEGVRREKQRQTLCLVDGIVAGEGGGPEDPDAVRAGVIVTGMDAACTDAAAATTMGFDPMALPMIAEAFEEHTLPLTSCSIEDVVVSSNDEAWDGPLSRIASASPFRFTPYFSWESVLGPGLRDERPSGRCE